MQGLTVYSACEIVSGQRLPFDETFSDSSSSGSEVLEKSQDEQPTTELEQTMRDIHDIISSLYELSIMLRDPAPRDRLLKLAAIDVSYFEQWDKMHVVHKFPKAHSILVERLARANIKRRQYFKYLEKHHYKLALGSHANVINEELRKRIKEPSISGRNRSDKAIVEIGPRSYRSKYSHNNSYQEYTNNRGYFQTRRAKYIRRRNPFGDFFSCVRRSFRGKSITGPSTASSRSRW